MRISIACNNYRNGHAQGWFDAMHIGEMEFEGPPTAHRHLEEDSIRLGRHKYKVSGSMEWVGNWCWNEYEMEKQEVLRLLRNLKRRGWSCQCGPSGFFQKYNRKPKHEAR